VTAWLDYLDARRRMVHEWREQGVAPADIAVRLEVDTEHVERIVGQLVDPPLPGCSREVAARLARRVADLERELHGAPTPPPERPTTPSESEFRALRLHPDPEVCGCQYWRDATPGKHHPRCEHPHGKERP
jgi:hypothetical protein